MFSITIWQEPGKSIVLDTVNNKHLLSINIQKNMNNDVGTFSAELAPWGIKDQTWTDIIATHSFVEIRKRGRLRMLGFVTSVKSDSDIAAKTIRYTIEGQDLGVFFTKYSKILTSKYLKGWTWNATSIDTKYKELLTQQQKVSLTTIADLFPYAWDAYFQVFAEQTGRLARVDDVFAFSNGTTLKEFCGEKGKDFFVSTDALRFDYPRWINFLQNGDLSFYDLVKSWVVPHFNEVWMDTSDSFTEYSISKTEKVKPKEGFRLYARPSLYNEDFFEESIFREIPLAKIIKVITQKTSEEMNSIYLVVAEGTYNTSSLFAQGTPAIDEVGLQKYGIKLLEANVKHAYEGPGTNTNPDSKDSIFVRGAEELRAMYQYNDELLSGSVTVIDTDMRVGEKIRIDVPIGDGVRRLDAICTGVTEAANFMQTKPTVSTNITFVRGRYVE